jgi:hypothetical protein
LALGRFIHIIQSVSALVRDVAEGMSPAGAGVRWTISDVHHSNVTLELEPRAGRDDVPPDVLLKVADAIVEGMAIIAHGAERPAYFTDGALAQAKALSKTLDDDVRGVYFRRRRNGSSGETVRVTSQVAANVDEIIGPQLESFGTVEGRLQGVMTHGKRLFYVWDALTNRRVECQFGDRIKLDEVIAAYEKRVAVRGLIRRTKTGEKINIEVSELRVFPDESELPSVSDVQGIIERGHD